MTYQEALDYIHSNHWTGRKPGLERIRALLCALGDPQEDLKFLHVAGTNGKGSVCAMAESCLRQAGYRTGLYTSPYIHRFNERFQVNGVPIPDETLCRLTQAIRPAAQAMAEPPTEFELITALAMVWFREEGCEIVVLEVGLGGELDPTNVIGPPEAAVITALGLDHTAILGDNLGEIAAAKGGIFKPGSQGAVYDTGPETYPVLQAMADRAGIPLSTPDWSQLQVEEIAPAYTRFSYGDYRDIKLPLLALYQPKNAALTITALELLRRRGWVIPEEAIRAGLESVRWPGRFEVLRENPLFLLDGSHNPQGVRATAGSLAARYPGEKFVFLLGLMADKDGAHMIQALAPLAAAFVAVAPHSPRALAAQALAEEIRRETGLPALGRDSLEEGVRTALELGGDTTGVCALGSLYFSGEIREAFRTLAERDPIEKSNAVF